MSVIEQIRAELLTLKDAGNQAFVAKLLPTKAPEQILGTKIPVLRAFAKQVFKQGRAEEFLKELPHFYLEEDLLNGFLIEQIKDFSHAMELTEAFLPFIDNWMVCDTFSPKIFKKFPVPVYENIKSWLTSSHTYILRYAIGLLLSNFLDENFQPEMLDLVALVQSEEYYVQMMQAWYFATALAKQEKATLPLIESQILSPFVQNKTIQKARESRRISAQMKEKLLAWKLKS
ncbi:MAG: DNA alkylation repair protein [candidate division SR1 bacterium]|nr:MAG: DNA alkylation repair protein [candidate division SR1 bacterium]